MEISRLKEINTMKAVMQIINLFKNVIMLRLKSSEIIFLIGVPGSGKSTLVKKMISERKWHNHVILSTDVYMEEQAKYLNKTYDEIFNNLYPVAEKKFYENLKVAIEKNKKIIIDRTNVSTEDRKKILDQVPAHYKKRAIVFYVKPEILKKRIYLRWKQTGKNITEEVMNRILNSYVAPTKEEFYKIENAENYLLKIR